MKTKVTCVVSLVFISLLSFSVAAKGYLSSQPRDNDFALVDNQQNAATFVVDNEAPDGLKRVVQLARADIERVTGIKPGEAHTLASADSPVVVVGIIGKSKLLDDLQQQFGINLSHTQNAFDGYHIEHIKQNDTAIWLIAGNNMRGAMYGLFDLSETIGVSPWYWWADVPPKKSDTLYLAADTRIADAPKIKYRGIFLNDEAPALTSWADEKFGGYNADFYQHVFELLLRLKANYLWPAMWNNAFADDDPNNAELANEMGIVMGTSHHEPMMRADKEWNRYGEGPWDYATNPDKLYSFWQQGAERYRDKEGIFTLGMRGQADTPMSDTQNIALLEKIVQDQRQILADTFTQTPIQEIPQVWTLYKEVQGYYESGMRVPDDVTLLWADDNFGNIRRLPTKQEQTRSGGAGVYYHFDYVGGPRSYRWINTVPLGKIYDQMSLAYKHHARKIWIVNVGDLKPMELPIDFFLSMAWNPEAFDGLTADSFLTEWATQQFSKAHAGQIAEIIKAYTLHNGRRKPEALSADTYSVLHYDEAAKVSRGLDDAVRLADEVKNALDKQAQNAFFQLVEYPVKATQAVYEMYHQQALNQLYGRQRRSEVNEKARLTQQWFDQDSALIDQYHSLDDGRWNHFMSQPHIGYVHWRNPPKNYPLTVEQKKLVNAADMGVAVEGDERWWPALSFFGETLSLPNFTPAGTSTRTVTVYNRQKSPFSFEVKADVPWIIVRPASGTVKDHQDIQVSIDRQALAEAGNTQGSIMITGTGWGGARINVTAEQGKEVGEGFLEADGVISLNAATPHRQQGQNWEKLAQHGRTGQALRFSPGGNGKEDTVCYPVHFSHEGHFPIYFQVSPTLQFNPDNSLMFGYALDEGEINWLSALGENAQASWAESVLNNVRTLRATLDVPKPKDYQLCIRGKDEGVVLQKIVIDTGGLKPSYLGPPESPFRPVNPKNE